MSVHSPRTAPGFSLVEMLVVIVITALTATLVMQGIGQGLGMFRRVTADQGQAYHELMSRGWIRQTLATAVAKATQDLSVADPTTHTTTLPGGEWHRFVPYSHPKSNTSQSLKPWSPGMASES